MKLSFNKLPEELKLKLKKFDWQVQTYKTQRADQFDEFAFQCFMVIAYSCVIGGNKWINKEIDGDTLMLVLNFLEIKLTPEIEEEIFPYLFGNDNDI